MQFRVTFWLWSRTQQATQRHMSCARMLLARAAQAHCALTWEVTAGSEATAGWAAEVTAVVDAAVGWAAADSGVEAMAVAADSVVWEAAAMVELVAEGCMR